MQCVANLLPTQADPEPDAACDEAGDPEWDRSPPLRGSVPDPRAIGRRTSQGSGDDPGRLAPGGHRSWRAGRSRWREGLLALLALLVFCHESSPPDGLTVHRVGDRSRQRRSFPPDSAAVNCSLSRRSREVPHWEREGQARGIRRGPDRGPTVRPRRCHVDGSANAPFRTALGELPMEEARRWRNRRVRG